MRIIPSKTILFLVLILMAPLYLFSKPTGRPLILPESITMEELGMHIEYIEDVPKNITIDEITQPPYDNQFIQSNTRHLNFNYSQTALWIRFTLINNSTAVKKYYLDFNYAMIDYLTFFIPGKKGYRPIETGDYFPYSQRPLPQYYKYIFPITIEKGPHTYYMRIYTMGSRPVPLRLWSPQAYQEQIDFEYPINWLLYGIMIAIFVYNLFIFISIKDISYLYLSLFIFGVTVFFLSKSGIAFKFLWPRSIEWANRSNPFFAFFFYAAVLQFSRFQLNTRKYLKILDYMLNFVSIIGLLGLAFILTIDNYTYNKLAILYGVISISSCIIAGTSMLFFKQRSAVIYLFASSIFVIRSITIPLQEYSIIKEYFYATGDYVFGSAIMALLFSIALADKINTTRKERLAAINELEASEARYRSLVERAHDGIIVIKNECFIYANKAMLDLLGYTEEELYSLTIADIIPDSYPSKKYALTQIREHRKNNKTAENLECQFTTKEKTIKDVLISRAIISIDNESGTLAIVKDISDLKKAQETIQKQYNNAEVINNKLILATKNLEEEKEQLRATLNSIGDAVITTEVDGSIILMNPVAEKLLECNLDEARGKSVQQYLKIQYESGAPLLQDPIRQVVEQHELDTIGVPLQLVSSDGISHIVEITGAPIINNNMTIGIILAIRDITQKHIMEKEMLKLSKLESLSVLAGGIAHDFNNLLTGIIGNISILKERQKGEDRTIIINVENATEQAVNLTRQLLTFSKGGEPVKKVISISNILKETVNFALAGSSTSVNYDIEEELWNVDADEGQIGQVIHNITINAMQAMPDGGLLTVIGRNLKDGPPGTIEKGPHVMISFTDQGPGIPAKNIQKVFDPYYTTKKTGSGLGLASSYSIVKRHDGHIEVTSTPGEGTTFTIYLKATQKKAEATKAIDQLPSLKGGKILVMDDEEYIIDVTRRMLTHLGYTVDVVNNGQEAIKQYKTALEQREPYDLIIADLTIPGGMGGKETIAELIKTHPDVTAIVSSGYSNDPVLANYKSYGFAGMLHKPFTLKDLRIEIGRVLHHEDDA